MFLLELLCEVNIMTGIKHNQLLNKKITGTDQFIAAVEYPDIINTAAPRSSCLNLFYILFCGYHGLLL